MATPGWGVQPNEYNKPNSQQINRVRHNDQVEFIFGMQRWDNIHRSMNIIEYINRIKDKNHMTFSTDAENAFDTLEHPFIIYLTLSTKWILKEHAFT